MRHPYYFFDVRLHWNKMSHKSYFLGVKELPYLPSVGLTKEYMYSYAKGILDMSPKLYSTYARRKFTLTKLNCTHTYAFV
ncbi:hypothetical protein PRUPE_2G182200 [Prunus persica]|uniref:Uncharacterized protein n=1 Tax=Prunus persica TaxID=3760 RepID=A0A251QHP8_PRUPE|nr:hypothetical protein PRUPE_2G182200 [Prunus persica]